ncbi:MAG: CAP domain-containing protein [Thermanaerothrix sp.]|uniref:CAP domain-containing protein n=1 Tax=Thermanaerothrix sp. TaxID=2972675 RepID=UPI003C7A0395
MKKGLMGSRLERMFLALLSLVLFFASTGAALAQEPFPTVGSSVSLESGDFEVLFTGCATGSETISPVRADFEQRVVELVNDYRASKNLPPLKRVAELDNAARYHARDMRQDDYFAHDSYDRNGNTLTLVCKWNTRITAFYKNWRNLGENIAAGYASPDSVMQGWLSSDGHRANIESQSYWEIGVGYDEGSGSYFRYWVQDFGRRDGIYPLVINREYAQTSDPNVELYIYGMGVWTQMRLRNDDDPWGEWQPFSPTVSWRLKWTQGIHTVCAELKKDAQIYTACDSIELSTGGPVLSVQPSRLSFLFNRAKSQAFPAQATLQITNSGNDQVISWRILSAPDWIRIIPTNGTTPSNSVLINLEGSKIPTSPSTYSDVIRVAVEGGENVRGSPFDVAVTLTVVEDLPYAVFLPAVSR